MMRAAPEPAYVLHHWAWSETSLIVDLFTRANGRLAVVAKGAKRPYSQLRSVLLPFQRIAVTLGRPKADAAVERVRADDGGEILTLRAAEFVGGQCPLPSTRLFAGFYLNELLMKLLARADPHVALFDAYADALAALASADPGDDEGALRAFELTLLRESGVLPELDRNTATQEALVPGRAYALRADSGLVAAAPGEPAPAAEDWLAIAAALDAGDGARLRAASAAVLPALKAQLRGVLHYHLGSSQLRTRQAMIELRRLLGTEPESR
jgi:DNA repair protein RecO (recombination protein O)